MTDSYPTCPEPIILRPKFEESCIVMSCDSSGMISVAPLIFTNRNQPSHEQDRNTFLPKSYMPTLLYTYTYNGCNSEHTPSLYGILSYILSRESCLLARADLTSVPHHVSARSRGNNPSSGMVTAAHEVPWCEDIVYEGYYSFSADEVKAMS